MKEDGQSMEIPLLARVLLTLAVVAATTAAVRWLVSSQRKKTRTASDAERLEICLGRQSVTDSRTEEIDNQFGEEGPALCHPQVLKGNDTSVQTNQRQANGSGPIRIRDAAQGNNSAPACQATSRHEAVWHQLEAEPPTTYTAIALFPKQEPVATGEPEALARDMAPGYTLRSQLEEGTVGANVPSIVWSLGQVRVPMQLPDATLPANTNHPRQADSVFVLSALPAQFQQTQGQGIDYTENGGHGDKRNSPGFGNRYSAVSGSPGELETGLDTVAASKGYASLCEESKVCQERGWSGDSVPAVQAAGFPTGRHPGTPVPRLQLENEGEEAHLSLQAKPLNSVPSETAARKLQYPPEIRPGVNTNQTMKAVSDLTVYAGESNASDILCGPAGGKPCTCSENSTDGIPGLNHSGGSSGTGCKDHEGCPDFASVTSTHEYNDPGNKTTEPCLGREPFIHPNRRLPWEGPSALPEGGGPTQGHSTAERGQFHAEWDSSEGGCERTQQHEETCPNKVFEASASVDGSQDELAMCHEKHEHVSAPEQVRAVSLGLPNVPSERYQLKVRSKESGPCQSEITNAIWSDLRGEGSNAGTAGIYTESGYRITNQSKTQLEIEICQSSDHDTTTKLNYASFNSNSKLGLKPLLEIQSVQKELPLYENSDCSNEVKGQASMDPHVSRKCREVIKQRSTVDDTPDSHTYNNNEHPPAQKGTSNSTSKDIINILSESDFQMERSHSNTYSNVKVNAGHFSKEQALYTPFKRDATISGCQTQVKEHLQADSASFEVRLQATTLDNTKFPSCVTETFENGQTYEVSFSEGDRNDSKSLSSEQGLKHIVKNESCPDELPFSESILLTEIEEKELAASHKSHTSCDVTGHPAVVYPSARETSQYALANFLPLPSPTATSCMVEKCTYVATTPLEEDSSCSVTNPKAKHDSEQRDSDMMTRYLNTFIASPTTPRLLCEGCSNSAATDAKVSKNEPTVQNNIEDNESVVGIQGTLETRDAHQYKEHYTTDLPKCDTSDVHVCKCQPGKHSALDKTEAMLDPSQRWNTDQKIYQSKENNEDTVTENDNDSKSAFKSEVRARDANPNTHNCIPEKVTLGMHIMSFPNELFPLVSEQGTTTKSSIQVINHNVESSTCTFLENVDCPDNLGTAVLIDVKVNELQPSLVSNKGQDVEDQCSIQDVPTLGPSNDVKHNLLLPSSKISRRAGVGEGNKAGHRQEQESISSNATVAFQLDGRDMVMDINKVISSEINKDSVAKNYKEGSCHSVLEQFLGSAFRERFNNATLLHHGISNDLTNEARNEDIPKTQMLQELEVTLPGNKIAYPIDLCVANVKKTQQCEERSSYIQDVYTSNQDFSEFKMSPHGYLCLQKQPRAADSKNNLYSETSESGYTTDSLSTPVYEERSWSSLGTGDEDSENNDHELDPIMPNMEQTRDTTSHRDNYTASTVVSYNHINHNSISTEGKSEEKDHMSTEGSQYPSVKVGVDVGDNLFSSITNACVEEIGQKHIGLLSDHLQQSLKDNFENLCREDSRSCTSWCPEQCRTCSNTDKSHDSDNTMLNVSSHHVKSSEEAQHQCHKLHEKWYPPNTAEVPEQTTVGKGTNFIQGLRGVDINNKDEEVLTDSGVTKHLSADPIPLETCSESLGTITHFQSKIEDTHQAPQSEEVVSNKQLEKEEHSSSTYLFSHCTKPLKERSYEWKIPRHQQDGKAITYTKKLSSGSYGGFVKAKTESLCVLHSGQESYVSRVPSRSTPDDVMDSLTFSENEHSKSNKSHSITDTHLVRYGQTKDESTKTLDAVFGENDKNSSQYAHHTRHQGIPTTVPLPSSAFHETHSPPGITPFVPSNSNFCMDRPTMGESETASNMDYNVSSINASVELERKMHQRRKGIQRRGSISEIAENPDLRIYETGCSNPKTKMPLAKSCEDILSGAPNKKVEANSKARSMLCLLTEHYSLPASKGQKIPVEHVAKGSFLNIPETLQLTEDAMKLQLNLGNCLELLKFAKKNRASDLQEAAYAVMSDNYLQVLREPAIYSHLSGGERDRILQLRTRGKKVLGVAELETIYRLKNITQSSICPAVNELPLHSQGTDRQPHAWLYTFNMLTNAWHPLTQIPEEANLKGCGICTLNNYLFLAGGIRGQGQDAFCSNKVFCYNPLTEIWRQVMPMNQARSQLRLVAVDGYLYAIGGECLYTVERYDPRLDKWTFRASLPRGSFAVAHEAVTCSDEIYVSGGNLFYRLLKYSPLKDLWEECPYNSSRKRSCDMVAIRNFIYRFDIQRESGVSVFKYNTTTKIWNECATMCLSNPLPFRCAVLDGSVYCLNKKMIVRFSTDDRSQGFVPDSLHAFPGGGGGALCPFVLTLPHHTSLQTSV
ncbi:hypothetical protein NDU88_000728 [Pleurodeles waltl]|uniref:Uncharacterized protein n=1 Tax=Pleurodeles waltl TaxID=8319 RepID=A0AAV7PAH7_PLEWA|nr:hypothetical protein NDU88_000728 [Pleurodeles waltl]